MQYHFITQNKSDRLILFFAGWGMDESLFTNLKNIPIDCCVCFNYTIPHFDVSLFTSYKQIEVYGWSMGVWAAAYLLQQTLLPIRFCRAINGTLHPVDEKRGIPPSLFYGTLDHLDEACLLKFYRRMCGTRETFARFMEMRPQRDIEDIRIELGAIGQLVTEQPPPSVYWGSAIIGQEDRIFPTLNQLQAWQGVSEIQLVEGAHFLNFHSYIIHE